MLTLLKLKLFWRNLVAAVTRSRLPEPMTREEAQRAQNYAMTEMMHDIANLPGHVDFKDEDLTDDWR